MRLRSTFTRSIGAHEPSAPRHDSASLSRRGFLRADWQASDTPPVDPARNDAVVASAIGIAGQAHAKLAAEVKAQLDAHADLAAAGAADTAAPEMAGQPLDRSHSTRREALLALDANDCRPD
jgi:hypothetical protein